MCGTTIVDPNDTAAGASGRAGDTLVQWSPPRLVEAHTSSWHDSAHAARCRHTAFPTCAEPLRTFHEHEFIGAEAGVDKGVDKGGGEVLPRGVKVGRGPLSLEVGLVHVLRQLWLHHVELPREEEVVFGEHRTAAHVREALILQLRPQLLPPEEKGGLLAHGTARGAARGGGGEGGGRDEGLRLGRGRVCFAARLPPARATRPHTGSDISCGLRWVLHVAPSDQSDLLLTPRSPPRSSPAPDERAPRLLSSPGWQIPTHPSSHVSMISTARASSPRSRA